MKMGFHMGVMYNQAQQEYNISGYNAEVDIYNAWVQKNFGKDTYLLMQKMPMPGYPTPTTYNKPIHAIDESFNESRRILESSAVSNEGRIFDMPAGAYYTWNPYALEGQPIITNNQIYGGLR
ncbi:MAG: hypothetical protein MUO26_13705 [Methanotrichaceae archaeon]|nr:hypothetical protein [Methanotrichaceae archaeon]